ncbi:flagellar hook protein FlgE [uncultured Maricaulis sp.]|uniref:flagellar hook protein FlgE n=1 Tax=uncultured Maricaulis sp. TaxID=174710 RepID=UPI0030DA9DEB
MSINSAMIAGASGLIANSSALAAISDNIANVNTVGYKRATAVFTPLYRSQGTSQQFAAGGIMSSTKLQISESGLLSPGSSPTDLAVSGDGFFVVSENTKGFTTTDPVAFTRAGSFSPDANGYLKNSAGLYLAGWPVQADGTIDADPSDLNALEIINPVSIGGAAEATTEVGLSANLQASQAVSASEATYNAAASATNMASGALTADVEYGIPIYDSQGGVRTINLSMMKSSTPNQWHAELHVSPASEVTTGTGLVDGQIATGIIAFDANGNFDVANSTLPTSLNFLASANAAALTATQVQWAASEGINSQAISLELGGPSSAGGLTQFDSQSALAATSVNGTPFGDFSGVDIDGSGMVFAKFTNGIVKKIYQIPVATFANADGLEALGGGAYGVTRDSGSYTLNTAGVGAAGNIAAATLESSNVDLATEFTNLIITQRAYSASSKIITTADEMLDEAIRMKR